MAHLVENMFSVGEVPWHGLGRIVKEAPSAEEAIRLAGLDWRIQEHPISFGTANGMEIKNTPIGGYKALVRSDNSGVLSVMKDSYQPLQNSEAFKFFDPYIEQGFASFETAGSLKDGKVIWVLAKLNKAPIEVGRGDEVNKFLLLSNSHDGTMAVRTGFTPVRVVCNNTLTAAHGSSKSQLIRVMHTKNLKYNLENVQQMVNAYDARFEATAEQYKRLASKQINSKDLEKYVNIIFELRPNGDEREKSRAAKMQEIITGLFENGAGAHLKSARGTMWGAYNAVTNYLTHHASKDSEQRLQSNWFGSYQRKNEDALNEALVEVA